MKQRFIALLLAVCIACTMLVMPASASSANSAVQAAVMLGGLTSEQAAGPDAALTRGQLAKLLAAFSPYRQSAGLPTLYIKSTFFNFVIRESN